MEATKLSIALNMTLENSAGTDRTLDRTSKDLRLLTVMIFGVTVTVTVNEFFSRRREANIDGYLSCSYHVNCRVHSFSRNLE
jgi:predicted lysophospholipase L1 biosynthesis ABC-type transport system permease subunit